MLSRGKQARVGPPASKSLLTIGSKRNSGELGRGFRSVAGPATSSALLLRLAADPEQQWRGRPIAVADVTPAAWMQQLRQRSGPQPPWSCSDRRRLDASRSARRRAASEEGGRFTGESSWTRRSCSRTRTHAIRSGRRPCGSAVRGLSGCRLMLWLTSAANPKGRRRIASSAFGPVQCGPPPEPVLEWQYRLRRTNSMRGRPGCRCPSDTGCFVLDARTTGGLRAQPRLAHRAPHFARSGRRDAGMRERKGYGVLECLNLVLVPW